MRQFSYRPPSAGRSLIRNSKNHNDDDDKEKILSKDPIEEKKINDLRAIIFSLIREIFS